VSEATQESGVAAPRVSDADRDQAIAVLNNALVIGELSPEEHEERVQAALEASTVDSLRPLTADLTVPSERAQRWSNRRRVVSSIAVSVVIAVIVTSQTPQRQSPGVGQSAFDVEGLTIQIVLPGTFAKHDPANECGDFGAEYQGGGDNCYLVVQFRNTKSSSLTFIPVDLYSRGLANGGPIWRHLFGGPRITSVLRQRGRERFNDPSRPPTRRRPTVLSRHDGSASSAVERNPLPQSSDV
jgi:hypothetical protein